MHRFRRPCWTVFLLILMLSSQVVAQMPATESAAETPAVSQAERDLQQVFEEFNVDLADQPLSAEEREVANLISQRVTSTEWLGALGPVALSPFFGLTCLSGIAIVGEDRLPPDHYLRRVSTPLRNPLVFLTFLVLTVLTSIPKLSKVSKPFAQACDQLETYSALVILLVIRLMGSMDMESVTEEQIAIVYQAGFIQFSAESLLMVATVVNVIVINTVKFFFEVLIWITPVPFIDAIFEASNKAACAALAGAYAFSPTLATIINLVILAVCLLAFRWVKRREVYYRSILFDFLKHWLGWNRSAASETQPSFTVFPQAAIGKIPRLACCEIAATNDGWQLTMRRLFRSTLHQSLSGPAPVIQAGLLINHFDLEGVRFSFGKRNLAVFARECNLEYNESIRRESHSPHGMATELA